MRGEVPIECAEKNIGEMRAAVLLTRREMRAAVLLTLVAAAALVLIVIQVLRKSDPTTSSLAFSSHTWK